MSPSSHLTVESSVSGWAGALVRAIAVLAGAAIQAGFGVALIDVVLAVAPGETRRAQTREGVDAVHTGAAVEAGAAEKNKNKCCMTFSKIKVFCSFLGRGKSIELSLPELQAHLICPQKVKKK